MSNFPRRSPRFQQQVQSSQPSVGSIPSFESSRASSAASTSHPSPTGDITNQNQQYSLGLQSQFLAPPSDFDAPLPSPSANDLDPFGQTYQFNMSAQSQNQNATNSKQSQSSQQSQQQQHFTYTQPQRPNYPPTSVNGIPPGLPADFLAEAAKRAQMACLMRDLGDVSL